MNNKPPPAALPAAPAVPDETAHNLADYDWVPVLRKPRADGWSPHKQRAFIGALADSGSVAQAAQAVGMTERGACKLRRSPGAEAFDRAWAAAIDAAARRLLDEAFERALVGSDEPVFDREGNRVGRRFRKSDRMLQFLLRGYFPERFGYAGQSAGLSGVHPGCEGVTARPAPVAEALDRLLPRPPAAPHVLLDPDELECRLAVADLGEGKLPHWYGEPHASD